MTETYTFSRPIKFRAWDKENKEWHGKSNPNGLTHYGFSLYGECMLIDPPHISEIKHIEVTQFTGLLDKNGVEIYDGDIIEIHSKVAHTRTKGGIYYNERVCAFMVDDAIFKQYIPITSEDYIEVIGNIYEHPHLLEVHND